MTRTYLERDELVVALAEIFRRYGYEGASIGLIARETGAGRSSLYHFFPGGKEEMADAVLAHISRWFEDSIFKPLREFPPAQALPVMLEAVDVYFRSGQRICLIGAFALDEVRDRFAVRIQEFFRQWADALQSCFASGGMLPAEAEQAALDILAATQGAIVVARALPADRVFYNTVASALQQRGVKVMQEA